MLFKQTNREYQRMEIDKQNTQRKIFWHPFFVSDVVPLLIRVKENVARIGSFSGYFHYYITTTLVSSVFSYVTVILSRPSTRLKTSYVDSFLSLTTSWCFYFLVFVGVSSLPFSVVCLLCVRIETFCWSGIISNITCIVNICSYHYHKSWRGKIKPCMYILLSEIIYSVNKDT